MTLRRRCGRVRQHARHAWRTPAWRADMSVSTIRELTNCTNWRGAPRSVREFTNRLATAPAHTPEAYKMAANRVYAVGDWLKSPSTLFSDAVAEAFGSANGLQDSPLVVCMRKMQTVAHHLEQVVREAYKTSVAKTVKMVALLMQADGANGQEAVTYDAVCAFDVCNRPVHVPAAAFYTAVQKLWTEACAPKRTMNSVATQPTWELASHVTVNIRVDDVVKTMLASSRAIACVSRQGAAKVRADVQMMALQLDRSFPHDSVAMQVCRLVDDPSRLTAA